MASQYALTELNEAQMEAVKHVEGPMLTIAGPGSGKTRVVTHRIANLLHEGVSPFEVLALTFTNKAAQEMRHRVHSLVTDAPIWVGTFHGYCARFLRNHGRHVGLPENFTIFDTDDSKKVMQRVIAELGVMTTHLNIGQIINRVSALKNRLVTPEMMLGNSSTSIDHVVSTIYPAYQKMLLQNAAVDFDDLLVHTATILRTTPELRAHLDRRHRFILVDEYQDTNLAQYLIVRALSIDFPNLSVTGDPDQSIYSWRGANIENILKFEQDYPSVKTVRLEQNYRSTPEILSIADQLIQNNSRRKAKVLIPTRESGARVKLVTYLDDRAESQDIAEQIAISVLEQGGSLSDFAVLYRTNAQSRLLEQALLARRLNYQLIGGFRFYHRQEIKDLLSYLRLLHNPADDVAFERAVNTPTRGLGAKTLDKVRAIANDRSLPMIAALRIAIDVGAMSPKASKGAKQFLALVEKLGRMTDGPLVQLLKTIVDETDYVTYINGKKSSDEDDSIQGNIDELIADAADVDSRVENENALEIFLEQVSLLADTDALTGDSSRVTLMTLHAAKGLEFKHVFLIAVEGNILPHARSMEDPAAFEEERRLLFVGITRAKQILQLSIAKKRGFGKLSVPSTFLMELPRAEMEICDKTDPFERYEYDQDFSSNDDFMDDYFNQDVAVTPAKKPNPLRSKEHQYEQENTEVNSNDYEIHDAEIGSEDLIRKSKLARLQKINLAALRPAAQMEPVTTQEGESVERFLVGSGVSHPKYGNGSVVSLDGRSVKRVARVRFEDGQTKTFQLVSSPLTLRST